MTGGDRSVVVIGGGIAGLAAAWELTGGERADPGAPRVTLVESGPRLGGPLHTEPFGGRNLDVGPDGFLGRRPEAVQLCRELGLGDQLRAVGASGASLYVRGRLRPLPGGLLLGVPTRWWPVARSGVLGPAGSMRLLRDSVVPRPDRRGPLGDRALGPLVGHRLGRQVVDALVDPLVGGIHAGSVADMSTAAVLPLLLAVPRRGSLMRALRRAMPSSTPTEANGEPAPLFWSLHDGMGSLVERLGEQLRGRGVEIRMQSAAERLQRGSGEPLWSVETTTGRVDAGGIVLAVPAGAAAALLEPHNPDAAALARSIEYGSVALVTLSYRAGALTLPDGTGFLVPRHTPSHSPSDEGELLITAATFLDKKWPHLARPGSTLVRASVGRFGDRRAEEMDDPALCARVSAELAALLGADAQPQGTMVTRWDQAFAQYRVGHLMRVSGIEAAVKRLPALAVAGASYRGVGIPACIASGRDAARELRRSLDMAPQHP